MLLAASCRWIHRVVCGYSATSSMPQCLLGAFVIVPRRHCRGLPRVNAGFRKNLLAPGNNDKSSQETLRHRGSDGIPAHYPMNPYTAGVSKLFSKRARFDEVNMREGRPFCPTFCEPLKFGLSVFIRATNTMPNNNCLAYVAVCGE